MLCQAGYRQRMTNSDGFSVQIDSLLGCSHSPPITCALPRAHRVVLPKIMLARQDRFLYVAGASLLAIASSVEAKGKSSSQKTSKPANTGGGGGSTCYDGEYVHPTWFGCPVS